MTRWQIRPFYTDEERARIYHRTYDHTWWPDHLERVAKTSQLLGRFAAETGAQTIADLSCGDAAIIQNCTHAWRDVHVGDLVLPPPGVRGYYYSGPIEETVARIPAVDMFLCSETLEHVEDPDALLRAIRDRAKHLLLTTPCGENHTRNPEHYWGWGWQDVKDMLLAAGWTDLKHELWQPEYDHPDTYLFQMWTAS